MILRLHHCRVSAYHCRQKDSVQERLFRIINLESEFPDEAAWRIIFPRKFVHVPFCLNQLFGWNPCSLCRATAQRSILAFAAPRQTVSGLPVGWWAEKESKSVRPPNQDFWLSGQRNSQIDEESKTIPLRGRIAAGWPLGPHFRGYLEGSFF